jgi:hypothetical protein
LNPRLIAFLFVSVFVGMIAAVVTLIAGGGILLALGVYCLAGSLSLVALSVVAVTVAERKPQPETRRLHA